MSSEDDATLHAFIEESANVDGGNAPDISRHITALNNIISGEQSTEPAVCQPMIPILPPDHGTTTMLVDIFELITAPAGEDSRPTVLIVDDSIFYRNLVRVYLEQVGFRILEGIDGIDALRVLEASIDSIGLVVTDIEMPNMDGFELTRRIKESARFCHLPVIALTSRAAEEDVARGKAAGVDEYHIKLDREQLVESVGRCIRIGIAV